MKENIYSKNILEFVKIANKFCNFSENPDKKNKPEFIEESQKILSELYLKTLYLESGFPEYDSETEKFVSEEDWFNIKNTISRTLAESDIYGEVYENNMTEPIDISISECFADIYQDIKDFIELYKISNIDAVQIALFEVKDNFERIWGQKLLFILKELHQLITSDSDWDEEELYN